MTYGQLYVVCLIASMIGATIGFWSGSWWAWAFMVLVGFFLTMIVLHSNKSDY